MFIPSLAIRDRGGALLLVASVNAPNGCYFNAGHSLGWPNGMVGVPETLAVQLKIGHSRAEICHQSIVTLEYAVPLGDISGRNRVAAFSVEGGAVRGRSSIAIVNVASAGDSSLRATLATAGGDATRGSGTDQRFSLDSAAAWVDRMPIDPPSFHVVATVRANSSGWNFTLQPANPQGINPDHLILDLKATEPTGPVLWVFSEYDARYDVQTYGGHYTHVTVRDGDVSVTVPVREVF